MNRFLAMSMLALLAAGADADGRAVLPPGAGAQLGAALTNVLGWPIEVDDSQALVGAGVWRRRAAAGCRLLQGAWRRPADVAGGVHAPAHRRRDMPAWVGFMDDEDEVEVDDDEEDLERAWQDAARAYSTAAGRRGGR